MKNCGKTATPNDTEMKLSSVIRLPFLLIRVPPKSAWGLGWYSASRQMSRKTVQVSGPSAAHSKPAGRVSVRPRCWRRCARQRHCPLPRIRYPKRNVVAAIHGAGTGDGQRRSLSRDLVSLVASHPDLTRSPICQGVVSSGGQGAQAIVALRRSHRCPLRKMPQGCCRL